MKTELQELIEHRDRLTTDLKNSPTGYDLNGKPHKRVKPDFLIELDRRINLLQKRG